MSKTEVASSASGKAALGDEIVGRINQLAAISGTSGASGAMSFRPSTAPPPISFCLMREAGMAAHLDAIGNVCIVYEGDRPLPCLMLGSHYDTVRDTGEWDGPLGLITVRCRSEPARTAAAVRGRSRRLCRRGGRALCLALLGSRAVAGTFVESALNPRDHAGVSMRDAMVTFGLDPERIGAAARTRRELHAYVELHIEQGPVLEGE